MINHRFPDLAWLKKVTEMSASERLNYPDSRFSKGWPSVILNVNTHFCDRPEIKGPFSIFCNFKGNSFVEADSHKVKIEDDTFFFTNNSQYYSLGIDNKETETFNIHFGEEFYLGFISALNRTTEQQLDVPDFICRETPFFNRLFRKDQEFIYLCHQLKSLGNSGQFDNMLFEQLLYRLASHFWKINTVETASIRRLNVEKRSTSLELYKRISIAVDYIYSCYSHNLTLDELAKVSCMSRFHFLRVFSEITGKSPHQFILEYRINKASDLLRHKIPVNEIALYTGFSESSTFSRAFRKLKGVYPKKWSIENGV
jgi:AraC family transcriptional regulator